jgi:hypothetical protein
MTSSNVDPGSTNEYWAGFVLHIVIGGNFNLLAVFTSIDVLTGWLQHIRNIDLPTITVISRIICRVTHPFGIFCIF